MEENAFETKPWSHHKLPMTVFLSLQRRWRFLANKQTNKNKKTKSLKAGLLSPSWKGFNAWSAKICLDPRAVQLLWPGIHPTDTGSLWECVF